MRNGVTESELVQKAEEKGGERVTLLAIEAAISSEHYFTALQGTNATQKAEGNLEPLPASLALLTICTLTMWNGFTILGKSACADPANYDKALGRRIARADAVNQIWPLMGYELRSRMERDAQMASDALVPPQEGFETYIGTKVINAKPMSRRFYNILRGWILPDNERGEDEGYLVEYTDRVENPPHVDGFKGYVSWSPQDVFERAYRPVRKASAQPKAASAHQGAGSASEGNT